MATFTTDQVRQFYVIDSKATSFDASTPVGAGLFKSTQDGEVFLTYKSPNSEVAVRSDLIGVNTVTYAKSSLATKRPLGLYEVKMAGAVIPGQEYVLRIVFDLVGSYDHKVYEVTSHKAKTGDTAETVLEALVDNFNLRFKGLFKDVLKIAMKGTDTITFEEIAPQWVLGKKQARPLLFKVQSGVVTDANGIDEVWAEIKDVTATNTNKLTNGYTVADMEWFYYGERADQYRMMGYPNNFDNKYIVDVTKEYDFIDIEYFYAGDAEDVTKSKKSITLAIAKDSTYALADIITDLGTLGITVK